jgi:hypothetical protein
MQRPSTLHRIDARRPFTALLLEDDQERAAAVSALLSRLARPEVRVIRMGGPSPRSRPTLERILIQVAGLDGKVLSGDNAHLIVRAVAKRQRQEERVVLLIEQAHTLHPKMLHALQAMGPHLTQDGEPTLQVTFVGRPAFRARLDGEDMASLREALGFQTNPPTPGPQTASPFAEPDVAARQRVVFPDPCCADSLPERGASAHIPNAARPLEAKAGAPGELDVPSAAALPRSAKPADGRGGPGHREPMRAQLSAPLLTPSAAELSKAPVRTLQRGGILLRLMLMPATVAIMTGAAYTGLHRLFYRDVPARPVASVVTPVAPQAASSATAPAPSIPVPSTPTPPPALQDKTAPSAAPALPPPAAPSARLRQDFDDFLANSRRNGATLSEAQRSVLFGEYLDWRSQNNLAASTPSAALSVRVVIHVQAGSEAGEALSARLLASLRPRFGTVEARRVAATPAKPSIRYFHPEDEPAARLAAAWLADMGLNWTLQDFSAFRPLPSGGTIEVWLPRQP